MRHFALLLLLTLTTRIAIATDYVVGPTQELTELDQVPWEKLQAGDRVGIQWREKAYQAKWVICAQGTPAKPIAVIGIKGPKGQLPVIDGRNAITRPSLDFWAADRGIIKIGGSEVPGDLMPKHIVIQDLEIRGARPGSRFVSRGGIKQYRSNASAIYIEKGESITIRGCRLMDSGNGLLVAPQSKSIVVEACYFANNGIENSFYEHHAYSESLGITYQGNRFAPLRKGCRGNAIKDRSAGLVIRYNWIEGGNRQLDLVEAEGGKHLITSPLYRTSYVYGNVFIEHREDGNNQIVHYGGDNGKKHTYRKGVLHFYNNTVVSFRDGATVLFRLSTDDETVDCRNNIVHVAGAGRLALVDESGVVKLEKNWLQRRWVPSHSNPNAKIIELGTTLDGDTPGFSDTSKFDFNLSGQSPCVNSGGLLETRLLVGGGNVTHQYLLHQGIGERPKDEKLDLGAFEHIVKQTKK